MRFQSCTPKDILENPVRLFDDWMLLTAGDAAAYNAMTVSWGGLGMLWGLPAATCYVRPSRHTYGLMERGEHFTLSAYGPEYHSALALCGSKSGRDVDKASACGLTPAVAENGAPYFQEARLVLVCKKLYFQDFDPANFLDGRIAANYSGGDYHRMYVGEVVEVLMKK